MPWLRTTPDGVVLNLRVVPRAAKNEVAGTMGDALKIRLQAPPVEGKANEALIHFLAEKLDVPARYLTLLSGSTGRQKRVLVAVLDAPTIRARLC